MTVQEIVSELSNMNSKTQLEIVKLCKELCIACGNTYNDVLSQFETIETNIAEQLARATAQAVRSENAADSAEQFASDASTAASSASTYKEAAISAAQEAGTSATAAASSASTAEQQAEIAAGYADDAATSANTAATKASAASTSATNAASSASAASTSAINAASSASAASTSATNAASSAIDAASLSINAASSASNAASSASAASTSATNAASSASNAASSASAASTSATQAAASATQAAGYAINFTPIYTLNNLQLDQNGDASLPNFSLSQGLYTIEIYDHSLETFLSIGTAIVFGNVVSFSYFNSDLEQIDVAVISENSISVPSLKNAEIDLKIYKLL